MKVASTFGERLRTLRLAAGLSQAELAGEDLSASYISLLEGGKRSPSSDVIEQLATRLGCSTSQLMEGRPSEREERIEVELAYARLAIEHGEAAEARRRLERLLTEGGLSLKVQDEISGQLGVACDRSGDLMAAIQVLLPLFERACAGRTHLLVHSLGLSLAGCYQDVGDLVRAVEVGEQALAAARSQGLSKTDDYFRLAATVMWAYVERGDWVHARIWAEELLAEAQAEGQRAGQGALYWNLGLLAAQQGDHARALKLYEQAFGRLSELDNSRDYARLRLTVATALLSDDPPGTARAMDLLRRCEDDVHDLCGRDEQALWHLVMSVALFHEGEFEGAETEVRRAEETARDVPPTRAEALEILSDILAAQNREQEAAVARRAAMEAMKELKPTRTTAQAWRGIAERLVDDDPQLAIEAFRRALDVVNVRDLTGTHRRRPASERSQAPVRAAQTQTPPLRPMGSPLG